MFWVIFSVFFAVLFSIFFLLPGSSSADKKNESANMQNKLNESQKKQQMSSIQKTMNSEYSTYSKTLTEMSQQKLNEVNNNKKKKVTIHLNGLLKTPLEIPIFASQIKSKFDHHQILFVFSTEGCDQVTEQLIAKLKEEFKLSSFIYCKTPEGVQSILRQLNPRVHIDSQVSLLTSMKQHLHKIIYISSEKSTWESLASQYNQKNNIFFKEDITDAFNSIAILVKTN